MTANKNESTTGAPQPAEATTSADALSTVSASPAAGRGSARAFWFEPQKIAQLYRHFFWLVVLSLLFAFINGLSGSYARAPFAILGVVTGVTCLVVAYQLAKAISSGAPWLHVLLMLVPGVGIVEVIALMYLARKALRAHGVQILISGAILDEDFLTAQRTAASASDTETDKKRVGDAHRARVIGSAYRKLLCANAANVLLIVVSILSAYDNIPNRQFAGVLLFLAFAYLLVVIFACDLAVAAGVMKIWRVAILILVPVVRLITIGCLLERSRSAAAQYGLQLSPLGQPASAT